ncbi:MAG: hypothetical protein NZ822_03060 [Patescibacteria group bacterium]|nr:hypothetical protein [Patescibacteria group bacterium]
MIFRGREMRPRRDSPFEAIGRRLEGTPNPDKDFLEVEYLLALTAQHRKIEVNTTPETLKTFEAGFLYLFLRAKIEQLKKTNQEENDKRILEEIENKMNTNLKDYFEEMLAYREANIFLSKGAIEKLIGTINTLITRENKIINFRFFHHDLSKEIFDVDFPPNDEQKRKLKKFGFYYEDADGFYFKIGSDELINIILQIKSEMAKRDIQSYELRRRLDYLKTLRREARKVASKDLRDAIDHMIEGLEVSLRAADENEVLDENFIKQADQQIKNIEDAINLAKSGKEKEAKNKVAENAKAFFEFLKNFGSMALVGLALWGVFFAFFLPVYFVEKVKKEIKI